jgi:hypothetical protein
MTTLFDTISNPESLILIRDVTPEECDWLTRTHHKGERVYRFTGATYGCCTPSGLACFDGGEDDPFYELPLDALTPEQATTTVRPAPHFDGETYDPALDHRRLTGQLERVYRWLAEAHPAWVTAAELGEKTGDPTPSVQARLRDLRKEKFGAFDVESRRRGDGLAGVWEYRLTGERGSGTPTTRKDRLEPLRDVVKALTTARWHWGQCEEEGEGACCMEATKALYAAHDAAKGAL